MAYRMMVRRAMNLKKLYKENTRLYISIHTQKSNYRYGSIKQDGKNTRGESRSPDESEVLHTEQEQAERPRLAEIGNTVRVGFRTKQCRNIRYINRESVNLPE